MPLTLHTLKPAKGSRAKKFRVGRGHGSGRGKTAGRGTKGQRSRTGGRKRLRLKGMKQMLLGFPKLRGFTSRTPKPITIGVERLNAFEDGAALTPQSFRNQRMIVRKDVRVKIVGNGELKKKLTLKGIAVSASAKAVIEKAGGMVVS